MGRLLLQEKEVLQSNKLEISIEKSITLMDIDQSGTVTHACNLHAWKREAAVVVEG